MENQNTTIYQGEDQTLDFFVTDDVGAPKTLTGATLNWGLWRGGVRLLTKSSALGATLVNGNGTNDVVRISLAKEDTVGLPARLYYHECRIALAGAEQVIATGQLLLRASLTALD